MTFDQFAAQQTRSLLGLAVAMCGDVQLAEDVVQDVLLKVHLRWDRICAVEDPPSYVRRMVTNEYLSWRRKWSRVIPFADAGVFEGPVDAPDTATTLTDRADIAQRLSRLTRRQRAVLALRYYEGMTDAEIALTLGCGAGSVRSHASRGLNALRLAASDVERTDRTTPGSAQHEVETRRAH